MIRDFFPAGNCLVSFSFSAFDLRLSLLEHTLDMDSTDDRKEQQKDIVEEQDRPQVNASGSEKPADPSASDADRSCQSKEETGGGGTEQDESSSSKDGTEQDDASNVWTAAWDENSQAYYWWNMVTYETTWENPYDKKPVEQVSSDTASPTAQHAYPTTPTTASFANQSYTYQAYFNKRTGKFQLASDVDRLNPERMSIENRAKRQMQYYFDVDAYTEERNRQRASGAAAGQKRQLSKKDIERFKRAKHEKKMKRARDWLCD